MKRARKIQIAGRVLLVVAIIAAIVTGGAFGYMKVKMDRIQGGVDADDVVVDENIPLLFDEDIVNILLLGVDENPEIDDEGRSDSTMIASIDFKHNQLKLTSLMRDMYVDIPERGYAKFNQAYSDGGVERVIQTVTNNFGIRINGYATVNFDAFAEVIDILGGVEIDINQDEYEWIQENCKRKVLLSIKPGLQTLNGDQALLYSRLRFVGNNDFERTERQRRVLSTLFEKFKGQSYGSMVRVMMSAMNYIKTDLTTGEIQSLVYNVLKMNVDEIDQLRLPLDGTYYFSDEIMDGVTVNVVRFDLEQNREALHRFIYGAGAVDDGEDGGSADGGADPGTGGTEYGDEAGYEDYEDYEDYDSEGE